MRRERRGPLNALCNTTLLVTARHAEAAPLIAHLRLVKDVHSGELETYQNDTTWLIVTGSGKLRCAVMTASFLSRKPPPCHAINIGIAECPPQTGIHIGDMRRIHKIVDHPSGREQFPDMLVDAAIGESSLTTVDSPLVSDASDTVDGLIDMEGSGFFEAASTFLSPHRISCLKIASDRLDDARLTKASVSALVAPHVETIARYAERVCAAHPLESPIIDADARRWLDDVSGALNLTTSQAFQLEKAARGYLVIRKQPLPALPSSLLKPPSNKRERAERLRVAKQTLGIERE